MTASSFGRYPQRIFSLGFIVPDVERFQYTVLIKWGKENCTSAKN